MSKASIAIISTLTLIVGGVIVDCSCGTTKHLECSVQGREYKPPYTDYYFTSDSDGNMQQHSTYYPEEYHIFVFDLEDSSQLDINTSSYNYNTLTNNQVVNVSVRIGHWTKTKYLPTIE